MKLRRIHAITAALALLGACLWSIVGDPFATFVWIAASVIWLALAIAYARSPRAVADPIPRLVRRLTNLLIWS